MDVVARWRRIVAHAPSPGALSADRREVSEASPSAPELRERCLRQLLVRGMPLWTDKPEHCDACGRELLLGERARLMYREEELLLACPLCAERLLREGCVAVGAGERASA